MVKFCQTLIIVTITFSLIACETELPRRYKSVTEEQQTRGESLVRVSGFVIEKPKSSNEPGILKLSAEGQASLINAVAKADKSINGIYQELAKGFERQSSIDVIDRSQVTVRIIFSTQKAELAGRPADRISRLELILDCPTKELQFQQWNRFETEYGQADLGKIGLKKAAELNAKLSPEFGGTLSAGETGVTVSRELSEEVALRQRFIALTGTLDKNKATLVQEGVAGIDLSGNTSIDLTIKFTKIDPHKVVKFDSFRTSKGFKTPDEVSYRIIPIFIPNYEERALSTEGLLCPLKGNYVLRHVIKGDATFIEGDDKVIFVHGAVKASNDVLLISSDQIRQMRTRYIIKKGGEQTLVVDDPRNPTQLLAFATYQEAEEFLDWISSQNAITIGGRKLKLSQEPLVQSDIANLRIGVDE